MEKERLETAIFDAIASKRVIKVGYVGIPGGIYAPECDSVASHSFAVSVLAFKIAYEYKDAILASAGLNIDMGKLGLLAIFHDYGETKSLDTGAQSKGLYPDEHCKLHSLEKEGLATITNGLKIQEDVIDSYQEYRDYSSVESIIVHIADNLEGIEKAFYAARGNKRIIENALHVFEENVEIYHGKKEPALKTVGHLMVSEVLAPGVQALLDFYGININTSDLIG